VFTPTDTTTSGSTSNTVDGNRGDRHATRNIRGMLGHDRGVLVPRVVSSLSVMCETLRYACCAVGVAGGGS
jgi:hypothetical protein